MRSGARIFDRNSDKPTRVGGFYLLPDGRAKTSLYKLQFFEKIRSIIFSHPCEKLFEKIFVDKKKIISITLIKRDK